MHRGIRWLPLLMLLLAPRFAAAQGDGWTGSLHATRGELEALLAQYQDATSAEGYSSEFRQRARQETSLIRDRLVQGDFKVGDVVALTVTGQQDLTNNFTVSQGTDGPVLKLPYVGEVPLKGLLRSELEPALVEHIGRFIREPQVFAQTSIRLQIFGAVGQPGFHVIPADAQLTDAIMLAGGPTSNAKQDEIEVKRGSDVIWDDEPLQQAIIEGRTIDQLSIRAGDRIEVPEEGSFNLRDILYPLSAVLSLTITLTRIF